MTGKVKKTGICANYHHTIEFIGKKWMGAILYSLSNGPMRYNELYTNIDGISDRLLTQRLNELIESKLVEKILIDNCTKKTMYRLTENGLAFKEVILSIKRWSELCTINDKNVEKVE